VWTIALTNTIPARVTAAALEAEIARMAKRGAGTLLTLPLSAEDIPDLRDTGL
jgi:hypothetical protein